MICNVGTALYRWDNALNNHYSISDNFYYAVKNLPTAYVANTYKRFIDDWGTVSGVAFLPQNAVHRVDYLCILFFQHFIKSVTLGGRKIRRFRSDYNQVYSFARNEVFVYHCSIFGGVVDVAYTIIHNWLLYLATPLSCL